MSEDAPRAARPDAAQLLAGVRALVAREAERGADVGALLDELREVDALLASFSSVATELRELDALAASVEREETSGEERSS